MLPSAQAASLSTAWRVHSCQLLEPGLSKTDLLAETRNLAERLIGGEVCLAEVVCANSGGFTGNTRQVLLVIDQFEELYTLCSDTTAAESLHR